MRHLAIAAVLVGAVGSRAVADDAVLTPIAFGQPRPQRVEPAPNAKGVAIAGTVVTAALLTLTVVAYEKREDVIFTLERDNWQKADPVKNVQLHADEEAWRARMLYFGAATIVSGAVTGYLWSRTEPSYETIVVAPANHGGSVSYTGRF
jgi:hypothetical protein